MSAGAHIGSMRRFILALAAAALSAGTAQAQILGGDAFLEQRLRTEVQRLEADQRSAASSQFRFESELAAQRVQSTVRNEVVVGPSPDESARYRVQGGSPEQARLRAERLRQQRVERGLNQMRSPARR